MAGGGETDRAPLHGDGGADPGGNSRRKSVMKWLLVFGLVLVGVLLIAVPVAVSRNRSKKIRNKQNAALTVGDAANQTCRGADDVPLCVQTLLASGDGNTLNANRTVDLQTLASFPFKLLNASRLELGAAREKIDEVVKSAYNTSWGSAALACNASLFDSLSLLDEIVNATAKEEYDAVLGGLSALRTETADCAEALFEALNLKYNASSTPDSINAMFQSADSLFSGTVGATLYNSTVVLSFHLSNALSVIANARDKTLGAPRLAAGSRRLYRRRLLAQASVDRNLVPNFIVDQSGEGDFRKVQEAINAASALRRDPKRRIVIKVKAGVYREKVLVPKELWMLTVIGDGPTNTRIVWGDYTNPIGTTGLRTRETYTFAVEARGFLGIDLAFVNDAGQSETVHQAVAVRASLRTLKAAPEKLGEGVAAFVGCHFLAHQDTLYSHTGWQYYFQCVMKGTVDYIFGNAAAVYQNCDLHSIRTNGTNTITAQARTSETEPTGFVFRNCRVDRGTVDQHIYMGQNHPYRFVYLGRPWRPFSRVVFMFCYLGGLDPAGWMIWTTVGRGSDNHETAEYYEYQNTGPGSSRKQRVQWSRALTDKEAEEYTVDLFIHGRQWLPQLGIAPTV